MSGARPWLGLLGWLALTFAAAAAGAQFLPGPWYEQLSKPTWTPPDAVFAPVWTLLYLLMAVAAWLVWKDHGWREARVGLGLYVLQLAVNAAWSALFFGGHAIGLALVDVILLWLLVAVVTVLFWRRRPLAGALLLPYVVWVAYAATLNGAILSMNG